MCDFVFMAVTRAWLYRRLLVLRVVRGSWSVGWTGGP
jgi:hypothetical protein